MLTSLGNRVARPAIQAAGKFGRTPAASSRLRFTTRAAVQDGKDRRTRNDSQLAEGRPGVVRRPVSLATDLFFPGQVGSLFREVEDEIARLWGNESQKLAQNSPLASVDIKETKDAYVFNLDTPGLSTSDVKVSFSPEGVLVISGERTKKEESDESSGFHRVERAYGKFQRRFALPENIDASSISAQLKHGELTVRVPKKEAAKKQSTHIPVSGGEEEDTKAAVKNG